MKRTINAKKLVPRTAEQLSSRLLVALISLSVVVFALFYAVGFDTPFYEDANFNAPLLTDLLLFFSYAMIVVAVVVAVVAAIRGIRTHNYKERECNIPTAKIGWGTVALLVVSLIVFFLVGSSAPINISGEPYENTFWLKATDMFIFSSATLIAVAVAAVCYGLFKSWKRG